MKYKKCKCNSSINSTNYTDLIYNSTQNVNYIEELNTELNEEEKKLLKKICIKILKDIV